MPASSDLLIVGAGPAGTAAAITAARAGLQVTVIDKANFPRDKCCGDGLTTLALRQLESLGLEPASVSSWFDLGEAWLRSPSGREVRLPLPHDGRFAAVAPRRELDDALVRLASATGVTVLENHSFVSLTQDSNGVSVTVTRSGHDEVVMNSKWLIAADGMWSPVRKSMGLGLDGYLGEWHAFRQYAHNVTGVAKDRLIVWFEPDLLPGYAWSFPVRSNDGSPGRVNIGFGVLRDGERRIKDMRALWSDFLARPHIVEALGADFELEDRHTAWPIPARIDQSVTGAGRVLFVGDAAMATDVLTGEGIGQALLTGVEAATAVIHGLDHTNATTDTAAIRRHYAAAVRGHLVADHRMSVRLSRVLASERGARGAIALVAKSGEWGRRNFARWMFEDEPRAIMLTPKRWHRRLFRQRGAY